MFLVKTFEPSQFWLIYDRYKYLVQMVSERGITLDFRSDLRQKLAIAKGKSNH